MVLFLKDLPRITNSVSLIYKEFRGLSIFTSWGFTPHVSYSPVLSEMMGPSSSFWISITVFPLGKILWLSLCATNQSFLLHSVLKLIKLYINHLLDRDFPLGRISYPYLCPQTLVLKCPLNEWMNEWMSGQTNQQVNGDHSTKEEKKTFSKITSDFQIAKKQFSVLILPDRSGILDPREYSVYLKIPLISWL